MRAGSGLLGASMHPSMHQQKLQVIRTSGAELQLCATSDESLSYSIRALSLHAEPTVHG